MFGLGRLAPRAQGVAARGFATEKEIAMRITATKNIKKITSSMKMVSASKLRGDQNRLDVARKFSAWTSMLSEKATPFEDITSAEAYPQKNVVVAISSDKGLCGGVHSVIARSIRGLAANMDKEGKDLSVLVVGDKARAQLRRMVGSKLDTAYTECSLPYSFDLSSVVAVKALEAETDAVHVAYNVFKSAIAYTPSLKTMAPFVAEGDGETLATYEFEPETKGDVMAALYEHYVATEIYYGMMEGQTSEQSSRMQAMENATKNAGELIDKLTLLYNRARQARITTELIEIISGASALE